MSVRTAPRLVGRYLLCDLIASGGMASVHLARLVGQEGFTRTVALKQLYPHFARDRDFVAMFLDEARLLSRIRHPNVVAPLDIIAEDAELFIAMEYVHGEALSQLVRAQDGPVPPALSVGIAVQALLGLHAAHEATGEDGRELELVHRDVSPQNILVGQDGIARIVDFGIAKAASRAQTTGEGRLKGKLGYMAPEQIRLEPTDRRADIFTTAIVLWELLTGQRLFPGEHPGAVVDAILSGDVKAPSAFVPSIPPALEAVVLHGLAPRPVDRYATAREMAGALARASPPASTIEIGAWVESLAAHELTRRAELIADVERIAIGELTLTRRAPAGATAAAALTPAGFSSLPVHVPREASTPAAVEPLGASLTPTSATKESPRRRAFLPFTLAAVGALSVTAAAVLLLPREGSAPVPAASLILEPLSAAANEAPHSAVSATEPSAVGHGGIRAESPSSPVDAQAAPVLSAPGSPRESRPLAAKLPPAANPARASSQARTERVVPEQEPEPQPSAAKPAPAKATGENRCLVPYTIDRNGIKRFKPECF